jgi:hypothetical protein
VVKVAANVQRPWATNTADTAWSRRTRLSLSVENKRERERQGAGKLDTDEVMLMAAHGADASKLPATR